MKRKFTLLILIGLFCIPISAQELKKRELKRISKLEINTEDYNISEEKLTKDLREILRKERKRKSNKTSGIILTSLSALSLGLGTAILATPVDSEGHKKAFRNVIGGFFIGTGAIEGGIGIPLLFVSKKRRKERDLLIQELNNPNK